MRAGFPFAYPRNRFWTALNGSNLIDQPMVASINSCTRLARDHGIGFTDVVKRPTASANQLRAADYARGAPQLAEKIAICEPQVLWFHGKMAANGFCRNLLDNRVEIVWGWQSFSFGGARCFVSPNPSPANASYSLVDLIASYNQLAEGMATGEGQGRALGDKS